MKIAVAQIAATKDLESNRLKAVKLVAEAAAGDADLVVFPEMSVLEFFPKKPHRYECYDLAEPIPGPATDWWRQIAREHRIAVVYNHYELSREHLYFDTSVVIDRRGNYIGRQRMMHLAEEPGYNEKFYYTPGWDRYHVFQLEGWRFGIAICYDRHFPEVFRSFILQGAELVLIPTAVSSGEPFSATYDLEMRAAAVTHGVYIAMANRVGEEPPLSFFGRSMVISPYGEIVRQLADEHDKMASVAIDKTIVTKARSHFPFLRDRRPETYAAVSMWPPGDVNK